MRTNPKCTGSDKEEGRTIYTPRSNQGLETNKQMKVIKTTIYQPIYQSKKRSQPKTPVPKHGDKNTPIKHENTMKGTQKDKCINTESEKGQMKRETLRELNTVIKVKLTIQEY